MNSRTLIRQWHSYIGVFVAPSVLFFALTGAVQLFSLHEAHGHYQPPAIIEKLSSVHKDQEFKLGHHHAAEGADAGKPDSTAGKPDVEPAKTAAPSLAAAKGHDDEDEDATTTTLLKWFFLVVAVCLTFSTAFGVWMGLTQTRRKSLAWSLLVAGALIPLGLLLA
jgi:hypothetical protein